jgi:hypothetical protein
MYVRTFHNVEGNIAKMNRINMKEKQKYKKPKKI